MCSPLHLPSWPRAILHVDGDAFFSSCEQALHPELRGKPVVTGKERNIVAAASYEAKARGVQRGVALWEARRRCPGLVVLPSDYETYSLFSQRMFAILRRFTPTVEEYSIDEAFADLTGLRRLHRANYGAIAERCQATIHRELGLTVSAGVSLTKTLAKLASKRRKPAGLTVVSGRDVEAFLADTPIEKIWNIGPNTAALLQHHGVVTALDFATRDARWVSCLLAKPGQAVWHELNGRLMSPVYTEAATPVHTIGKTKTFTPPSADPACVFAQLTKNLENACAKARRHQCGARRLLVFLRRQDFRTAGAEASLPRVSAFPLEMGIVLRQLFTTLFVPGVCYRATGVILADLAPAYPRQVSLFESPLRADKLRRLYDAVDALRTKYGKHAVHHGASLAAQKVTHLSARGDVPWRKTHLLPGETARQRLAIPLLRLVQ